MYSALFVPLDGSDAGLRGLQEAIGLAQSLGSRLVLWHAVENFPTVAEVISSRTLDELAAERKRQAQVFLDGARQLAAAQGVDATTVTMQAIAPVPDEIIDAAAGSGCGLIVMGTHGRSGFSRLALGSVAERVARLSRVPVLLVSPGAGD